MMQTMSPEERAAGFFSVGGGVYLRPSDQPRPMTTVELRAWLELRVPDPADMDYFLGEYAGKTLDEMEEIYDRIHGSMA